MPPRPATVRERLLLCLWQHRDATGPELPPGVSQKGMAEALGVARGHVALELGKLEREGVTRGELAQVRGSHRRLRAYALTPGGRQQAREVVQRWHATEVEVETPAGWRTVTLGETNRLLGSRCTPLELVQAVDAQGRYAPLSRGPPPSREPPGAPVDRPREAAPAPDGFSPRAAGPAPPGPPWEAPLDQRPPPWGPPPYGPWARPPTPQARLLTAALVTGVGVALLVVSLLPFLAEEGGDELYLIFLAGAFGGGFATLAGLVLAPKELPAGRELALTAAAALLIWLTIFVSMLLSVEDYDVTYDLARPAQVLLVGLGPLALARFGEFLPPELRCRGGLAAGVLLLAYGGASQAVLPSATAGEGALLALCGLLTLGVVQNHFEPGQRDREAGLGLGAALALAVVALELGARLTLPRAAWLLLAGWLAAAATLGWLVLRPGLPRGWLRAAGSLALGLLLAAVGAAFFLAGRPGEGLVELLLAAPLLYYGWPRPAAGKELAEQAPWLLLGFLLLLEAVSLVYLYLQA